MNPNLPTDETMSEGSPLSAGGPPASPDAKPAPMPLQVPVSFLAQPDNNEQMQTPVKGDSGTMQVDFTVVDIQGDTATVQPTAINGNDLGAEESGENPNAADEQEGQDLQSMANQIS